jgi:hypothetical protein
MIAFDFANLSVVLTGFILIGWPLGRINTESRPPCQGGCREFDGAHAACRDDPSFRPLCSNEAGSLSQPLRSLHLINQQRRQLAK